MKLTSLMWFSATLMVGCASTPSEHQDSYELCQTLAYGYDEVVVQELARRGQSATDRECGDVKREMIQEIEVKRFLWSVEHSLRHEVD
ncbi:hypothetical protein [Vibrio sp. 10N]|uniref:hypothetical protein n=1 Tax=Vibrio sp. 10N TaxID=3058938 RepID=UPI002813B28D|nr:hypothetical protein VB10N_36340 [Vibrio sp. 10N]